jgi:hypothetical protein
MHACTCACTYMPQRRRRYGRGRDREEEGMAMAMPSSAPPLPVSFVFFSFSSIATSSSRALLLHRRGADAHGFSLPRQGRFSVSLGRRLGPAFSDDDSPPRPTDLPDFAFEDGIFESASSREISSPPPELGWSRSSSRRNPSSRESAGEAEGKGDLIPDDWRFLQDDLHKTKVQRRRESRMQETANRQLKELRAQIRRRRKVEPSPTEHRLSVPFRAKLPDKDELLELEKVLAHRPLRRDQTGRFTLHLSIYLSMYYIHVLSLSCEKKEAIFLHQAVLYIACTTCIPSLSSDWIRRKRGDCVGCVEKFSSDMLYRMLSFCLIKV